MVAVCLLIWRQVVLATVRAQHVAAGLARFACRALLALTFVRLCIGAIGVSSARDTAREEPYVWAIETCHSGRNVADSSLTVKFYKLLNTRVLSRVRADVPGVEALTTIFIFCLR